ncbi:MAG: hypothetical protein IKY98_04475 [Alphaproteobacteria bacterium]|nr:hypothetical protein [Alphaproteobacteria bacterium]
MSFASKGSTACLIGMCIFGALTLMKSCSNDDRNTKIDAATVPERFTAPNVAQTTRDENMEIFEQGGVTAVLGGRLSGAHKRKYIRSEATEVDRREIVRQQQAARARRNQSGK